MARRLLSYHVTPRYTPGSPALVRREIAEAVAVQEKHGYEHALTGIMGDAEKQKAEHFGLRGIAEERYEQRDRWIIRDLVTGEHFEHLFPAKLEKLGFSRFSGLLDHERTLVVAQFPEPDAHSRRWFQVTPGMYTVTSVCMVTIASPRDGYTVVRYEPKLIEAAP